MMAGPKHHWVTRNHQVVTRPQRSRAYERRWAEEVAGCVKRKRKKANEIQAQPRLTKKTLKMLLLRAKYEGENAGSWEWAWIKAS